MMVGGYSLDLYCDEVDGADKSLVDTLGHRYDEFPHVYYGEHGSICRAAARRNGWTLGKRVLCPKCTKRLKPDHAGEDKP